MTIAHTRQPTEIFAPCAGFDSFAAAWFLKRDGLAVNLRSAVEYSFFSGGKRLRPVLVHWWACAMGGQGLTYDASGLAGLGVELIHCFSLVHDDLPALDNDDLRRGKPTLHRHAGEAMAILAGDCMTTLAFEVLGQIAGVRSDKLSYVAAMHCTQLLACATTNMISGQVYDTLGGIDPRADDRKRVELIHANKTGALIRAACMMGAWTGALEAGREPEQLEAVGIYADALGLIFQITDDLIDVQQSAEHAGKATGKDAAMGKVTYPGLMGVDGSVREVTRLVDVALGALDTLSAGSSSTRLGVESLASLCVQMAKRTK